MPSLVSRAKKTQQYTPSKRQMLQNWEKEWHRLEIVALNLWFLHSTIAQNMFFLTGARAEMGLGNIVTVPDRQTKLFKAEKWQLSKLTTTLTYPFKFSPYRSGWGFEILITHQLVQGL